MAVITMPKMGLTMIEGTLTKWYKKEGDEVVKGEELFAVETEKTVVDVEALESGIIKKLLVKEGDIVPVGGEIAVILKPGEQWVPEEKAAEVEEQDKLEPISKSKDKEKEAAAGVDVKNDRIKASPRAQKYAMEHGVELSGIDPTGPEGRVVERDVIRVAEERKVKATPLARKIAEEENVDLNGLSTNGKRITSADVLSDTAGKLLYDQNSESVPMSGMRKIIAGKMVKSKHDAPHYYLTSSIDMTQTIALREKIKETKGIKISFNDMLIKFAARALEQYPLVNSRVENDNIVFSKECNVGLAIALDSGLVVPVVKAANRKSLAEISKETQALISKAKEGRLIPDDYQGGTFTISNLGMYGIENFTAIINSPEGAILAVGKIEKLPRVVDDNIVVRPMMKLTLSCDHRIIDGAEGSKFLQRVKQMMEDPFELFL